MKCAFVLGPFNYLLIPRGELPALYILTLLSALWIDCGQLREVVSVITGRPYDVSDTFADSLRLPTWTLHDKRLRRRLNTCI